MLAVRAKSKTDATTIIPGRYGGIFLNVLTQATADMVQGIIVSSLFVASEVDSETARMLLLEVRDLLKEEPSAS